MRIRMPPENSATSRCRSLFGEAESEQHRLGAALGGVEIAMLELAQHVAHTLRSRRRARAPMLDARESFPLPCGGGRVPAAGRAPTASRAAPSGRPCSGASCAQVPDARALRQRDAAGVGRQSPPPIILSSVDLPAPLRPTRPTRPSSAIDQLTSARILRAPKDLERLSRLSTVKKVIVSAPYACRK